MAEQSDQSKLNEIIATIEKLQYGSVTVTIHDGQITQIDTTEKKRFSLQKKRNAI